MFLSNIFNGQFYTIVEYLPQVLSTIIIFVLTQAAINDSHKMDKFILSIVLLSLFICYQCFLQVTVGENWGGLEPLSRGILSSFDPETGTSTLREAQVIWYGILEDPNDLGMLLIAFMPYALNRTFYQTSSILAKLFWLLAFAVLGYTVILTNSRGSLVALIAALASFYIIKKRSMAGVIVALLLGLVVLALAPSRMGEIASGDHSAMGRIYAWILALELFAMNPLFGIGSDHFLDFHSYTTHNSYVLALVETGFLGFVAYFSLFVITMHTAIKVAYSDICEQKSTEIISLAAGLIGILISIFFISRTYVLLPFLYVAILTSYLRIYSPELHKRYIADISLLKLVSYCFGFIIFIYIFNRLATTLLI